MRKSIRFSIGALLAAVLVVVSWFHATTAEAQLLTWDPPCGTITVVNLTGCTADLNLVALSTGPIPTITVPPCPASVTVGLPPGGVAIAGVLSQAGTSVLLQTPVAAFPPVLCPTATPPPTTIADRVVRSVTLGPAPGCCFDVWFYRNNDPVHQCTVFLTRGTPPCTP